MTEQAITVGMKFESASGDGEQIEVREINEDGTFEMKGLTPGGPLGLTYEQMARGHGWGFRADRASLARHWRPV